jgi:catalase
MKDQGKTDVGATVVDENSKDRNLSPHRDDPRGAYLTTDQGVSIPHTDDSLKGGVRGPSLLEDFHLREKITRFDHERIPERVVHARGSGAHGYFQAYDESMAELTRAKFLIDPSVKTPVFVRFSTVAGSRGSADTVRDVRGFATKFYTSEGNFDLVGNNIPVFFIQDGIKFPDVVHAVKPEPHHEMPQAASAHDNFWDFASLVPETTHMLMWQLSDRALPRSYRMMEGFGVHTFRLVNEKGVSRFVKFHWKPVLGVHSLVWDEAQKISGKDPDFHRRDLWESIAKGQFPEYELGVQVIEEADEFKFGIDLLDPTKMIPEELVPVRRIGKMVLNRNPDNFFSETEQIAFCVSNLVPGIDVTDDPLMQARLFSYLDTQLTRLGGPNFAQIPINRPVVPVHNHQHDGFMQQRIPQQVANYTPNSRGGGCPMMAPPSAGGYVHYPAKLEGRKVRERSESFNDHYSQATLFWNSMSPPEKKHLVLAARFELGKVESKEIRQRMIEGFSKVDAEFARLVAEGVGVSAPSGVKAAVKQVVDAAKKEVAAAGGALERSDALSMANTVKDSIRTRKIAILAADGVSGAQLNHTKAALTAAGAQPEVISSALGTIKTDDGADALVDKSLLTVASVLYDAVFIPGGAASAAALRGKGDVIHFVNEAFVHGKAIGALGEGVEVLRASNLSGVTAAGTGALDEIVSDKGVVTGQTASDPEAYAQSLILAIAQHRHWEREGDPLVPA